MSAPPLPEIFGNYVLGDFVEVVAPTAVSWLPQTSGWLWLGLALVALIIRFCWRRVRHWYQNRYRREAVKRLQSLAQAPAQDTVLIEINRLLKLTAMAAFPREQVARLSGSEWVHFLNGCCTTAPFCDELGPFLAAGAYRGQVPPIQARQRLFDACNSWIREHHVAAHV